MTNTQIKEILESKGVFSLYHANTVATACTFIRSGGLLSRGAVRDRGLFQTSQDTDASDQAFDVFYDIFFDSVDIHARSSNLNYYGPVTFVYSVDLLEKIPEGSVQITKSNPKYWTCDMQEDARYFISSDELACGFVRGDFQQHITLRHQAEPLSFDCLEKVILDDPCLSDNCYFSEGYACLQELLTPLHIPLEIRSCSTLCKCKEKYAAYHPFHIRCRFSPQRI